MGAERALDDVDLGQRVDDPCAVGDVLLARLVQLARVRVDDLDALAEVREADAAVLEHHVLLRNTSAHDHLGRRRVDRVLDDVRGEAYHLAFAVDPGAPALEDREGLVVLDEDSRLRQDLERGEVDLLQLVGGEHFEPEAAALARARAGVASHVAPPPSSASIFLTPSLASSA